MEERNRTETLQKASQKHKEQISDMVQEIGNLKLYLGKEWSEKEEMRNLIKEMKMALSRHKDSLSKLKDSRGENQILKGQVDKLKEEVQKIRLRVSVLLFRFTQHRLWNNIGLLHIPYGSMNKL